MAKKSTVPASPFAHMLELFTAAERKLLDSSIGAALAKATHAQVDDAARKARVLRDKWRDLSAAHGRKTKRAGGSNVVTDRSSDKAAVFHDAVERFEARLRDLVSSVGSAIPKTTTARAKARDKTIAGRAARRTSTKPAAPETSFAPIAPPAPRTKVPVPKAPARKTAPSAKAGPVAKPAVAPAAPPAPKKPVATISKKARIDRSGVFGLAGTQRVGLDRSKQRSAITAAKAGRLAQKGVNTRRAAHTISRGKKNQARRDGRSR
jgi:hypothetical protein